MNKGYFFVLEGGEGSGKTTTSYIIKKILEKKYNLECLITREPGGDEIAEQIRDIIFDNNISAKTEALLFAAARKEHLNNVIIPALKDNKIVLCDRYIISSIVYQGIARNLGAESIKKLNIWATDNTNANLTFFYDITPTQALKRIKNDNNRELNRFDLESLEFHNRLYEGYKTVIKETDNTCTIDATQSVEDVANIVVQKIIEYVNE